MVKSMSFRSTKSSSPRIWDALISILVAIRSVPALPGAQNRESGTLGDLTGTIQKVINGMAGIAAGVAILFTVINAAKLVPASSDILISTGGFPVTG